MTGQFARRRRWKRSRLATATLGLLFLLGMASRGGADDLLEPLTSEQCKERPNSLNAMGLLLEAQGAWGRRR
jgi:hypothetical protein